MGERRDAGQLLPFHPFKKRAARGGYECEVLRDAGCVEGGDGITPARYSYNLPSLGEFRRVAGGDAVFSPRLAGFVLDAFGAAGGDVATGDDELDRLSAREREVMRLIARGYSYREVASELFISIKTVETHVSAVLRKLQLSSRHELTRWAAARRLL